MKQYNRDALVRAITLIQQARNMIAQARHDSSWVACDPVLRADVTNGADALERFETTLRRKMKEASNED